MFVVYHYRDPNTPIDSEKTMGTTWPQYDSTSGKYLAINATMSEDSVREHFVADSFNFWHRLIPKAISSFKHRSHRETHFHHDDLPEVCDKDGLCPP